MQIRMKRWSFKKKNLPYKSLSSFSNFQSTCHLQMSRKVYLACRLCNQWKHSSRIFCFEILMCFTFDLAPWKEAKIFKSDNHWNHANSEFPNPIKHEKRFKFIKQKVVALSDKKFISRRSASDVTFWKVHPVKKC